MPRQQNLKILMAFLALALALTASRAQNVSPRMESHGHGLRIFLGYLSEYKAPSYQSKFVEDILSSMNVQPVDLDELVGYFRALHTEISLDIAEETTRIVCSENQATLSGHELAPTFNAVLDYADATYSRFAEAAAVDLAGYGYPELIGKIAAQYSGKPAHSIRYDESGSAEDRFFDDQRVKICEEPSISERVD